MGGPMRMNPPRGMGGMGPQVGSRSSSGISRVSAVAAPSSPELEFSSLSVLLVLGKRGAAQIGSWCSICSTNWVERRTKARVRAPLPRA